MQRGSSDYTHTLLSPSHLKLQPPSTFQPKTSPPQTRAGQGGWKLEAAAGSLQSEREPQPQPRDRVRTRDTPIALAAIKRAQQHEQRSQQEAFVVEWEVAKQSENCREEREDNTLVRSGADPHHLDEATAQLEATCDRDRLVSASLSGARGNSHSSAPERGESSLQWHQQNDLDLSPATACKEPLLHTNSLPPSDPCPSGMWTGTTPELSSMESSSSSSRPSFGRVPSTSDDMVLAGVLQEEEYGRSVSLEGRNEGVARGAGGVASGMRQDTDSDFALAMLLQQEEMGDRANGRGPGTSTNEQMLGTSGRGSDTSAGGYRLGRRTQESVGGASGHDPSTSSDYEMARRLQEEIDRDMASHTQRGDARPSHSSGAGERPSHSSGE